MGGWGLAEVGVCLLLFSLGLEFSWRRLRALGVTALGGGAMQVTLALCAIASLGILTGLTLSGSGSVTVRKKNSPLSCW